MSRAAEMNAIAAQVRTSTISSVTTPPIDSSRLTQRSSAKGWHTAAASRSSMLVIAREMTGVMSMAARESIPAIPTEFFTITPQADSVLNVSEKGPPITGTSLPTVYLTVLKDSPSIAAPAIPLSEITPRKTRNMRPRAHLTTLPIRAESLPNFSV